MQKPLQSWASRFAWISTATINCSCNFRRLTLLIGFYRICLDHQNNSSDKTCYSACNQCSYNNRFASGPPSCYLNFFIQQRHSRLERRKKGYKLRSCITFNSDVNLWSARLGNVSSASKKQFLAKCNLSFVMKFKTNQFFQIASGLVIFH